VNLDELFGEATLKTLAIATAEDAVRHLAAGHPLRAAFSAAHCYQISGRMAWNAEQQVAMEQALEGEVASRLRSTDDTAAAWRAGYLIMLGGRSSWPEPDFSRLIRAVSPKGSARPWTRMWFAGQAADYYLLTRSVFWTPEELRLMLDAVRDDFVVRLRNGDRLMAADRVVLYKVLAESAGPETEA
jgi:hypothetical protein